MFRRTDGTTPWRRAILVAAPLLVTGCNPGDQQAIGIIVLGYFYGLPLLLVQVLLVVIAATRHPRRPELTFVFSALIGAATLVLAGLGLSVLGEAPLEARPHVARGPLTFLGIVTTLVVWMSLTVMQLRRSASRGFDAEGEPLPPPSATLVLVLGLAYPVAFGLAACAVCYR